MNGHRALSGTDIVAFKEDFQRWQQALEGAVIGQGELIRLLLIGILSHGHMLLEGLPGLGKTHLVKALANSIGLPLSRIQCTPDLMPSDVTGSEILAHDGQKDRLAGRLEFQPGPLFAPLVLVDEINRATPRTQSAFLEAMQEGQVTWAGKTHPLPSPFWIMATQNPIEIEGTYPLPEAQLDRFLFKLVVDYPRPEALSRIIELTLDEEPADLIRPVISEQRLEAMMQQACEVVIADDIRQAGIDLVLASQPQRIPASNHLAGPCVRYGASPRALQAILRGARISALADGRGHVALEDLRFIALPALRHRIMLSVESEIDGLDNETFIQDLIEQWWNQNTSALP